jgi:hypothetical protein
VQQKIAGQHLQLSCLGQHSRRCLYVPQPAEFAAAQHQRRNISSALQALTICYMSDAQAAAALRGSILIKHMQSSLVAVLLV